MNSLLIAFALVAVAAATPTARYVAPGLAGPYELAPGIDRPAMDEPEFNPVAEEDSIPAPAESGPLVQIILNINTVTGQVEQAPPKPVAVAEASPEQAVEVSPVQVIETPVAVAPVQDIETPAAVAPVQVIETPAAVSPVQVIETPAAVSPVQVIETPVQVIETPAAVSPVQVIESPAVAPPIAVFPLRR